MIYKLVFTNLLIQVLFESPLKSQMLPNSINTPPDFSLKCKLTNISRLNFTTLVTTSDSIIVFHSNVGDYKIANRRS